MTDVDATGGYEADAAAKCHRAGHVIRSQDPGACARCGIQTQQAVIVVSLPATTPEFFTWALRQIEIAAEFWNDEGPCRVHGSRDEAVVAHVTREFGGGNDAD